MGKKNKRQRAQNRITEGANVTKKMRTAGSSFSKKKARAVEKTMQQELIKRRKQEEQRKLQEQAKKSTVRKKQARVPYLSSDWILLIGEGNFSFARALARLFEKEPLRKGKIVATSYDSLKELLEKYPEAPEILTELARLGVTVLHGVDATSLHTRNSSLRPCIHRLLQQQQQELANPTLILSPIATLSATTTASSETTPQLTLPATTKEEEEEESGEEKEGEGDEEEEKEEAEMNNEAEGDEEGGQEGDEADEEQEAEQEEEQEEQDETFNEGEGGKTLVAAFDKIVFNFPHTGCGVKDTVANIKIHQNFMLKFFSSAQHLLRAPSEPTAATEPEVEKKLPTEVSGKDRHRWERDNQMKEKKANALKAKKTPREPNLRLSEVHVTLKQGEPYSGWQVPRLARSAGLRAKSGLDFFPELYPGYEHRRTRGVARENPNDFIKKAGQAKSVGAAKTYVFVPLPKELSCLA